MIQTYFAATFGLSMVLMLIYVYLYHRHYDIHISLIFLLVPISNLAQLYLSCCKSEEAAMIAQKFIYVSGSYLILIITLAIFSLCDIRLHRYIRLLLYLMATAVFFCTQQIGQNGLYYKNLTLTFQKGAAVPVKEYGPLHSVFYLMLGIFFLLGMGAAAYSIFKKNQVSNRFIILLTLPELLSFASFFLGKPVMQHFGLIADAEMPVIYDIALVLYLVIAHKLVLYNLPDTVIDTMVRQGKTGFLSCDFKFRYLGSNDTAKQIFPALNDLTVDKPISDARLQDSILQWLQDYAQNKANDKFLYHAGDNTYLITVSDLSDGRHRRGYQMFITDDTQNQQYIALLDRFNSELKEEVAEKTAHIVEMHDNLILSMAVMVESRDNSTGGHIKRTSEGVRILISEMQRGGEFALSEQFCRNLIKAAPMHDLGKIAVDDAVLRKPGRFTDAEFEIMKTHAAEGARIVHEILKGTDDTEFRVLAENVAHYHHERWDGSGYPDRLKGEQIPLEARIMAIADVYDALVSKRVYKERMSFEKADQIIMEGMGKHFDKRLEPYYIAARPRLEQYYSELG